MQSHIRKVHACLVVTCHLHFWKNDRDLLRATAVTRGWNGYRNGGGSPGLGGGGGTRNRLEVEGVPGVGVGPWNRLRVVIGPR